MTEADWLAVMSGERRGAGAAALRVALAAAEPGYAGVMRLRNRLYDRGVKASVRLPRPTISVGNLTTGGTGKTPVVRDVVRRLEEAGRTPAVLLRGYRRDEAGESDEAAEYRELGVHAVADPDRVRGAAAAMRDRPETDVFVLDDGFQHRRVRRDLDLVLIDATRPWGFDHVFPRGLLREPRSSLRRADAVIVTRADHLDPAELQGLDREIERWHGAPSMARVRHDWVRWQGPDAAWLRDRPTLAVCAIGNSRAFFDHCDGALARVVDHRSYPDHYAYDRQNAGAIADAARQAGAEAVVTTMKDWVKLKPVWDDASPPLAAPVVGIAFLDGDHLLDAMLHRVIDGHNVSL